MCFSSIYTIYVIYRILLKEMIFYFGKESWQAKEGNESLPKIERKG